MFSVTRRELLWLSSSGLLVRRAFGAEGPQNLSYPLRTIEGSITPPNLFFVRDHFNQPDISIESWSIRIEGEVAHPYELSFSDLVELPSKKIEAVLECAGNAANGSAVSNGVWEGLSLAALLERAQPSPTASFVMLEGADSGKLFEDRSALPYSQIVPLEKCREDSSLIAYKLNDLLLPKRNGFPARALFPGWYGMDSVKWLKRIVIIKAPEEGANFQQSGMDRLYNRTRQVSNDLKVTRVSSIQVKSSVAWPNDKTKLPAGRYSVWGFAWTGAGGVRDVALSTDAGKTWDSARLEKKTNLHSWVRWTYSWQAAPGEHILMSRASDGSGNHQPIERDAARKDGYELNWCVPIHVSVR